MRSSLAPDAFEGQRAFAELSSLAAEFPHRRPGSAGDQALAGQIAQSLRALGGAAAGGFTVHIATLSGTDDRRRAGTGVRDRRAPRLDRAEADRDRGPPRRRGRRRPRRAIRYRRAARARARVRRARDPAHDRARLDQRRQRRRRGRRRIRRRPRRPVRRGDRDRRPRRLGAAQAVRRALLRRLRLGAGEAAAHRPGRDHQRGRRRPRRAQRIRPAREPRLPVDGGRTGSAERRRDPLCARAGQRRKRTVGRRPGERREPAGIRPRRAQRGRRARRRPRRSADDAGRRCSCSARRSRRGPCDW